MPSSTSVLVVDDSALMRKMIKNMLIEHGDFEVHTARNGLDALDAIQRIRPDVVTLDIHMPEMDGLSCLAEIMRHHPTPVVMVSSLTSENASATLEALALGAVDYVGKPGGTVSLNLDQVAAEIVAKVRAAARARIRGATGLAARLHAQNRSQPRHRPSPQRQPPVRRPRGGGEPPPTRRSATRVGLTEAVLVGSSTGGPSLLTTLVAGLPADFPAPIVIAQHMPASFTGPLARRLDELGTLRTHEVTRPLPLRPGNVYVGHGDADVVVSRRDGELVVRSVPASDEYRWHPSVDRLVASARLAIGPERLVGVLLTGMGDDGAAEMLALHADGGRTIAESEETAVVWGMPGELVQRGGASCVLPADEIPDRLAAWVR